MQLLTPAPPRERRNDHQSAGVCQMNRASARETARGRRVVCVGDSNVCGQVSVSFVDLLRQRLSDDDFHFINAGVNGDLAHNILLRLDDVVARQPDFVVILVGSNDVNATLNPGICLGYRLWKRLPQNPSAEWYHSNMVRIVRLLKEKTSARIAIISPPVLGEDLASLPNERIRAYCALLRDIATQENVAYLPVHERQEEYMRHVHHVAGRRHNANSRIMWTSLLRHYVLRRSFDSIARENGFVLTTEGLHMNGQGAAIVADEAESFLRASG